MKNKYCVLSPVLFLIFNRPDFTRRVFEQIKNVTPAKLYIAADGPREHKEFEKDLCEKVRAITELIDWQCEVKTLFRDKNLGCKNAVSSAITWFFEHESEGIILEDDCVPSNDFFRFCDILLEKYRHDIRIRHISGCNLQHGQIRGNASYYFSKMTHVWGWASWRRVWNDYDKDLKKYSEIGIYDQFIKVFGDSQIAAAWTQIFADLKANKIDTWDYQLAITNFFNNSLSIIPNMNMISNIGFGEAATHTFDIKSRDANIPVDDIGEIIHPLYFLSEKEADLYTLRGGKKEKPLAKWLKELQTSFS